MVQGFNARMFGPTYLGRKSWWPGYVAEMLLCFIVGHRGGNRKGLRQEVAAKTYPKDLLPPKILYVSFYRLPNKAIILWMDPGVNYQWARSPSHFAIARKAITNTARAELPWSGHFLVIQSSWQPRSKLRIFQRSFFVFSGGTLGSHYLDSIIYVLECLAYRHLELISYIKGSVFAQHC